jgi:dUTPase
MGMRGLFLRRQKMFKVINRGKLPTRATKYSACVDLYANADVMIGAGETVVVPLGVCVDIEYIKSLHTTQSYYSKLDILNLEDFLDTHYLQLEPRSSLRAKGLQAGTGVIDLDFKDEICLIAHYPYTREFEISNGDKSKAFIISKGDRIAQIMLCEHKSYLFGIESEEERNGGLGSTGE